MRPALKQTLQVMKLGNSIVALLLLLMILVAANVIVGNLRIRRDFTADRRYTLSEGSRRILRTLPADVTLRLYFSRSLADVPMFIKEYAGQVEDLLHEFVLAAGGRLTLETHDPEPDSEAEEWAQRSGLQPQPTGMMTPPMYLGLIAVSATGHQDVIPVFHPRTEARLEYEIARLITRVADPEKPVIGVLSSLPVLGDPQPPMMGMPPQGAQDEGWLSFRQLREDFELRPVPPETDRIDDDIRTLVVIHPRELDPQTLFAIDQFVLRGGRLIAMVDPFSIADFERQADDPMARMMGMGGGGGPSDLAPLFQAWGIGYDPGRIVADMRAATTLDGGGGRIERNPLFLSLTSDHLDREEILTANLEHIMLPFAGAFSDRTTEDVTFTPLVFSSPDASTLVDAHSIQMGMEALQRQMRPDGIRRVLAARLTGRFRTAFPEGPPEAPDPDAPRPLDEDPRVEGDGWVVVIGDADFLYDRFCIHMQQTPFGVRIPQLLNNNIDFFVNVAEEMAGSQSLIAVRARARTARPFERVDQLEYQAALEWQAREENLNDRLRETQQRLNALQSETPGTQRLILTAEQQEAIENFRAQEREIRRELRTVRRNLRRDIDRLGTRVKLANIVWMPALVALAGLLHAWRRNRR